jgi:ribosome maturation factor RimP
MGLPPVAQLVREIAEPLAIQEGLEVVSVEHHPAGGRTLLRLYLDREGGVTLDELARVSRELGDLLDVRNVIDGPYTLEVSSPGINRPLERPDDFRRFVGKRVRIRATEPIDGRRNFLGTLASVSAEAVELQLPDGTRAVVSFAAIARANYEHDFAPGAARGPRPGQSRPSTAPRGA